MSTSGQGIGTTEPLGRGRPARVVWPLPRPRCSCPDLACQRSRSTAAGKITDPRALGDPPEIDDPGRSGSRCGPGQGRLRRPLDLSRRKRKVALAGGVLNQLREQEARDGGPEDMEAAPG